jgi:hypothetical protein
VARGILVSMPDHPLVRLLLAHVGGRDLEPHRPVPPHLAGQIWRYVCACGEIYQALGDATWRSAAWASPRRQCRACHRWNDGAVITTDATRDA